MYDFNIIIDAAERALNDKGINDWKKRNEFYKKAVLPYLPAEVNTLIKGAVEGYKTSITDDSIKEKFKSDIDDLPFMYISTLMNDDKFSTLPTPLKEFTIKEIQAIDPDQSFLHQHVIMPMVSGFARIPANIADKVLHNDFINKLLPKESKVFLQMLSTGGKIAGEYEYQKEAIEDPAVAKISDAFFGFIGQLPAFMAVGNLVGSAGGLLSKAAGAIDLTQKVGTKLFIPALAAKIAAKTGALLLGKGMPAAVRQQNIYGALARGISGAAHTGSTLTAMHILNMPYDTKTPLKDLSRTYFLTAAASMAGQGIGTALNKPFTALLNKISNNALENAIRYGQDTFLHRTAGILPRTIGTSTAFTTLDNIEHKIATSEWMPLEDLIVDFAGLSLSIGATELLGQAYKYSKGFREIRKYNRLTKDIIDKAKTSLDLTFSFLNDKDGALIASRYITANKGTNPTETFINIASQIPSEKIKNIIRDRAKVETLAKNLLYVNPDIIVGATEAVKGKETPLVKAETAKIAKQVFDNIVSDMNRFIVDPENTLLNRLSEQQKMAIKSNVLMSTAAEEVRSYLKLDPAQRLIYGNEDLISFISTNAGKKATQVFNKIYDEEINAISKKINELGKDNVSVSEQVKLLDNLNRAVYFKYYNWYKGLSRNERNELNSAISSIFGSQKDMFNYLYLRLNGFVSDIASKAPESIYIDNVLKVLSQDASNIKRDFYKKFDINSDLFKYIVDSINAIIADTATIEQKRALKYVGYPEPTKPKDIPEYKLKLVNLRKAIDKYVNKVGILYTLASYPRERLVQERDRLQRLVNAAREHKMRLTKGRLHPILDNLFAGKTGIKGAIQAIKTIDKAIELQKTGYIAGKKKYEYWDIKTKDLNMRVQRDANGNIVDYRLPEEVLEKAINKYFFQKVRMFDDKGNFIGEAERINAANREIYKQLGVWMRPTSGIRTYEYNKLLESKGYKVDVLGSEHRYGNAMDVVLLNHNGDVVNWYDLTKAQQSIVKNTLNKYGFKDIATYEKETPKMGHLHITVPQEVRNSTPIERILGISEPQPTESVKIAETVEKKKAFVQTVSEGINKIDSESAQRDAELFNTFKNIIDTKLKTRRVKESSELEVKLSSLNDLINRRHFSENIFRAIEKVEKSGVLTDTEARTLRSIISGKIKNSIILYSDKLYKMGVLSDIDSAKLVDYITKGDKLFATITKNYRLNIVNPYAKDKISTRVKKDNLLDTVSILSSLGISVDLSNTIYSKNNVLSMMADENGASKELKEEILNIIQPKVVERAGRVSKDNIQYRQAYKEVVDNPLIKYLYLTQKGVNKIRAILNGTSDVNVNDIFDIIYRNKSYMQSLDKAIKSSNKRDIAKIIAESIAINEIENMTGLTLSKSDIKNFFYVLGEARNIAKNDGLNALDENVISRAAINYYKKTHKTFNESAAMSFSDKNVILSKYIKSAVTDKYIDSVSTEKLENVRGIVSKESTPAITEENLSEKLANSLADDMLTLRVSNKKASQYIESWFDNKVRAEGMPVSEAIMRLYNDYKLSKNEAVKILDSLPKTKVLLMKYEITNDLLKVLEGNSMKQLMKTNPDKGMQLFNIFNDLVSKDHIIPTDAIEFIINKINSGDTTYRAFLDIPEFRDLVYKYNTISKGTDIDNALYSGFDFSPSKIIKTMKWFVGGVSDFMKKTFSKVDNSLSDNELYQDIKERINILNTKARFLTMAFKMANFVRDKYVSNTIKTVINEKVFYHNVRIAEMKETLDKLLNPEKYYGVSKKATKDLAIKIFNELKRIDSIKRTGGSIDINNVIESMGLKGSEANLARDLFNVGSKITQSVAEIIKVSLDYDNATPEIRAEIDNRIKELMLTPYITTHRLKNPYYVVGISGEGAKKIIRVDKNNKGGLDFRQLKSEDFMDTYKSLAEAMRAAKKLQKEGKYSAIYFGRKTEVLKDMASGFSGNRTLDLNTKLAIASSLAEDIDRIIQSNSEGTSVSMDMITQMIRESLYSRSTVKAIQLKRRFVQFDYSWENLVDMNLDVYRSLSFLLSRMRVNNKINNTLKYLRSDTQNYGPDSVEYKYLASYKTALNEVERRGIINTILRPSIYMVNLAWKGSFVLQQLSQNYAIGVPSLMASLGGRKGSFSAALAYIIDGFKFLPLHSAFIKGYVPEEIKRRYPYWEEMLAAYRWADASGVTGAEAGITQMLMDYNPDPYLRKYNKFKRAVSFVTEETEKMNRRAMFFSAYTMARDILRYNSEQATQFAIDKIVKVEGLFGKYAMPLAINKLGKIGDLAKLSMTFFYFDTMVLNNLSEWAAEKNYKAISAWAGINFALGGALGYTSLFGIAKIIKNLMRKLKGESPDRIPVEYEIISAADTISKKLFGQGTTAAEVAKKVLTEGVLSPFGISGSNLVSVAPFVGRAVDIMDLLSDADTAPDNLSPLFGVVAHIPTQFRKAVKDLQVKDYQRFIEDFPLVPTSVKNLAKAVRYQMQGYIDTWGRNFLIDVGLGDVILKGLSVPLEKEQMEYVRRNIEIIANTSIVQPLSRYVREYSYAIANNQMERAEFLAKEIEKLSEEYYKLFGKYPDTRRMMRNYFREKVSPKRRITLP